GGPCGLRGISCCAIGRASGCSRDSTGSTRNRTRNLSRARQGLDAIPSSERSPILSRKLARLFEVLLKDRQHLGGEGLHHLVVAALGIVGERFHRRLVRVDLLFRI